MVPSIREIKMAARAPAPVDEPVMEAEVLESDDKSHLARTEKRLSFQMRNSFKLMQERVQRNAKTRFALTENYLTCHCFVEELNAVCAGTQMGHIYVFFKKRPFDREENFTVCKGHVGTVTSVVYDPIAKLLFSSSGDRTVRVWDIFERDASKVLVQTLYGHKKTVTSVVSHFGKQLFTAGTDGEVIVWSEDEGRHAFKYNYYTKTQVLKDFGSAWVNCVLYAATQFVGDGTLFVADSNGTLHLYKPRMERITIKFRKHKRWTAMHELGIYDIGWSPKDNFLFTLSFDNTVRVTDITTGKRFASYTHPRMKRFSGMCYNDKLREMLLADLDGVLYVWHVYTGKRPAKYELGSGPITSLSVRPNVVNVAKKVDGEFILTAPELCQMWEVCRELSWVEYGGHEDAIVSVLYFPPNKESYEAEYLVSAGEDNTIRFWNSYDMKERNIFHCEHNEITALGYSNLCRVLITGHENGELRLWNPETGSHIAVRCHKNSVTTMVIINRRGKEYIATGSYDGTIRLWDTGLLLETHDNKPWVNITADQGEILCLAYTAEGQIAAGGNDAPVRLWNLGGRCEATLRHHAHLDAVTCMVCEEDLLLTGSVDCTIRVWKTREHVWVRTIEATQPVTAMCLIPNTKRVVSAARAGVVKIWRFLEDNNKPVVEYNNSQPLRCVTYNFTRNEIVVGTRSGHLLLLEVEGYMLQEGAHTQAESPAARGLVTHSRRARKAVVTNIEDALDTYYSRDIANEKKVYHFEEHGEESNDDTVRVSFGDGEEVREFTPLFERKSMLTLEGSDATPFTSIAIRKRMERSERLQTAAADGDSASALDGELERFSFSKKYVDSSDEMSS